MSDFVLSDGDGLSDGDEAMMTIFLDGQGPEETCVYLPEQRSRMHHRLIDGCTPEAYQRMLERGWRRFGKVFFRPVCARCTACRSLRLDVDVFRPDRSMRRTLKRNEDLRMEVHPAGMTLDHLDLYLRYHQDMSTRKGWREKQVSPSEYFESFVEGGGSYGQEIRFFDEVQLVGVALVDILPNAISAVYCYYEPSQRHRGLGVFSVLKQVELARRLGRQHVYLGYWIADNASMRYKARYRPHQLLQSRPEETQMPLWNPPDGAPTEEARS